MVYTKTLRLRADSMSQIYRETQISKLVLSKTINASCVPVIYIQEAGGAYLKLSSVSFFKIA